MAAAISDQGVGLGGIASLISTAAPLIFGSGTKKGTSTTSGTNTQTSTSSPTNDPALLALLKGIVDDSVANANDPSKTADMVNNIIRQAKIAFTPQLGQAARSGLYNSSTISKLADETMANSTAAASQAVLSYKTNQQQIASQGATALLNATKGSTTTTSTNTTGTTNETVGQSGTIPSQVSSLLGLGLVGLQAYSQRDKLLKLIGLGGPPGPGSQAEQDALIAGTVPPDFVSEADAFTPSAESIGGLPIPPAYVSPEAAGAASVGNFTTGSLDNVDIPIVGINSSDAADGAIDAGGGLDISSLLDDLPGSIGDAVSGVGDFLSGAGDSLLDAGTDIFKTISDLFDF